MSLSRRKFIWGLLAGNLAMLVSRIAQAAPTSISRPRPHLAFAAKHLSEAQARLFGPNKPVESTQIVLDIPDMAEDGATVPVSVSTTLAEVESITLLAEKNPSPLVAEFLLTPKLEPYVSTHIKLAATGTVLAVVRSQGRAYVAHKTVKVSVGGCG